MEDEFCHQRHRHAHGQTLNIHKAHRSPYLHKFWKTPKDVDDEDDDVDATSRVHHMHIIIYYYYY